jgi:hypothetical protein
VSKDPIGLRGGINALAYVKSPTHWVDPKGLEPSSGSVKKETYGPFYALKMGGERMNGYEANQSIHLTMSADPNIRNDQSRPRTDGGRWGAFLRYNADNRSNLYDYYK